MKKLEYTVAGQLGDVYLLAIGNLPGTQGRVLDRTMMKLQPIYPLDYLRGRADWNEPDAGLDVDQLLDGLEVASGRVRGDDNEPGVSGTAE